MQRRIAMVMRAQREFIDTGKTNCITTALEMLMETLPEEERIPVMVGRGTMLPPHVALKRMVRPTCEECGKEMKLRFGLPGDDFVTAWVCMECLIVEYTDHDFDYWLDVLPRREVE